MAKEEIKEKEVIAEVKAIEKKQYKVKKEFTLDKLYKNGSIILLEDGKLKETLIINKFI
jgi:hypothetical protein